MQIGANDLIKYIAPGQPKLQLPVLSYKGQKENVCLAILIFQRRRYANIEQILA